MSSFRSLETTFPLQKYNEYIINGVKTEIISTVYSDKIFVIISQLDKFGTILKADSEPRSEGSGYIYTITTLIGKRDDPLLNIYARQIIERLSNTTTKSLLLAISLLDNCRDTETFQTILNHLFQENAWN